MAAQVVSPLSNMAQLQSVQKAMELPTVEAAVEQVGVLYSRVKGAHSLLDWALSTAEAGVARAAAAAGPYVASPLRGADQRVAAAIAALGRRVPLVTEPPKVIVEATRQAVVDRVAPHVNKVCEVRSAAQQRVQSLKQLSWAKANSLLSTAAGRRAARGVNAGAAFAMQLLDRYLPAADAAESVPAGAGAVAGTGAGAGPEPAQQALQAVQQLSAAAARRVWANLARKVNDLREAGIELDPRRYVAALLAAVHLAHVTAPAAPAAAPAVAPAPAPAPAVAPLVYKPAPAIVIKEYKPAKSERKSD